MTAIEIIRQLMSDTDTTMSELAEYANLGTKSNLAQKLYSEDLKVQAFTSMLEVMGFQLVVQNIESDDEIIVDYDS